MQTFITDSDIRASALNLDLKRLRNQINEATVIARQLLGFYERGWPNHPAVRMWKDHEVFLVGGYLWTHLDVLEKRGIHSKKQWANYDDLWNTIDAHGTFSKQLGLKPKWITDALIESHRSNLIRKDPDYYGPKWPNTPPDLPYVWPRKGEPE